MEIMTYSDRQTFFEIKEEKIISAPYPNNVSNNNDNENSTSMHQRRICRFENIYLLKDIPAEGPFDMPKCEPVHIKRIPGSFVPYCCLSSHTKSNIGVHFFIHDYRFHHIWGRLEQTIKALRRFELVLSTDDSVFLDAPLIANLHSIYKSRVFTAVGQRLGVNVVPTFTCGSPNDIDYYCDGLPERSCIAVGGMGTNKSESIQAIFRYCVQEMCKRKHPELLLIYGSNTKLDVDTPIIRISPFIGKFKKTNV